MRFSTGRRITTLGLTVAITAGIATSAAGAASAPDPQKLIAGASQAAKSKGSFHFDLTTQVNFAVLNQSIHEYGDLLYSAHKARVVTVAGATAPGQKANQGLRSQIVQVGTKIATQAGPSKWQCTTTAKLPDQFNATLTSLQPKLSAVKLVGATTLNSQAVWHVHATESLPVLGHTRTVPTDLYIAQSDGTLVEQDAQITVKVQKQNASEKVITRFSRYGFPAYIALPKPCG